MVKDSKDMMTRSMQFQCSEVALFPQHNIEILIRSLLIQTIRSNGFEFHNHYIDA